MQHLLLASLALRLPAAGRREALLLGTTGLAAASQRVAAAEPGSVAARVEELKTLGTRLEQSGRVTTEPEHWPGRLQGQPPPTPTVMLRAAPPFVVLPGFGNDQADYVTPNGLPAEVGLQAVLARRGAGAVSVVPIVRTDWVNVAKGAADLKFIAGDAQPEGPAFRWYLQKAQLTIERAVAARRAQAGHSEVDARVVLIGHSAGGWLARALLAVAGDAWASEHVRGIATLGAPHASPPATVPDQTRGTIPNVNRRAPGAYYASNGTFYVTVTSNRVVGDAAGDAAARNAFTSYQLVLGEGQGVAGDGFVPSRAALLEGATQLTLDCYHSGGSADPWPRDDWYGAERNVDAWLQVVSEQIDQQRSGPVLAAPPAGGGLSKSALF